MGRFPRAERSPSLFTLFLLFLSGGSAWRREGCAERAERGGQRITGARMMSPSTARTERGGTGGAAGNCREPPGPQPCCCCCCSPSAPRPALPYWIWQNIRGVFGRLINTRLRSLGTPVQPWARGKSNPPRTSPSCFPAPRSPVPGVSPGTGSSRCWRPSEHPRREDSQISPPRRDVSRWEYPVFPGMRLCLEAADAASPPLPGAALLVGLRDFRGLFHPKRLHGPLLLVTCGLQGRNKLRSAPFSALWAPQRLFLQRKPRLEGNPSPPAAQGRDQHHRAVLGDAGAAPGRERRKRGGHGASPELFGLRHGASPAPRCQG